MKQVWDECLANNTKLPMEKVKCYDSSGYLGNIRYYKLFETADTAENSGEETDSLQSLCKVADESGNEEDGHQVTLTAISQVEETVEMSDDENVGESEVDVVDGSGDWNGESGVADVGVGDADGDDVDVDAEGGDDDIDVEAAANDRCACSTAALAKGHHPGNDKHSIPQQPQVYYF